MYVANGNAGRLSLAGQGPDGCRRLVIDKKPISPVCMRARWPCITITSPARFTVQGRSSGVIVIAKSFCCVRSRGRSMDGHGDGGSGGGDEPNRAEQAGRGLLKSTEMGRTYER